MLITTQKPRAISPQATAVKAPGEARKTEALYQGGDWNLTVNEGYDEFYLQSHSQASNIMANFEKGEASYTVYKKGGDFKTLSPEQKEKRLQTARQSGLESGLKVATTLGMVGLIGAGAMSLLGEVGSLLSTMAGGSGIATGFVGLGVIAAAAGVGGLISGVTTYFSEKNQSAISSRQEGKVLQAKNGFEFHPKKGSQDMTPVLVTKQGVTPLVESKG